MNTLGMMDFVWLRLRRVPRWAWISGALVVLLVPALLMWLLFTLVGGAWQSGSAMLLQEREALRSALPAAISDAQQAVPEAAAALRQLTGAAQAEVDAAIGDAQRTLPVAADALRQLTGAAQSEVDAAAREVDKALPGLLPHAPAEAPMDTIAPTTSNTPKD